VTVVERTTFRWGFFIRFCCLDNSLGLFYSFLLFRHLFGAFFIRFVVRLEGGVVQC